jgi:hypothetical protein
MRRLVLLSFASFLAVFLAGQASGLPRCDQINQSFCSAPSNCFFDSIMWHGSRCQNGIRQWTCLWWCWDESTQTWGWYYDEWEDCDCTQEGQGCDCLLAGTQIRLADGRTKPVERVQVGDQVLSYDESSGAMVASEVLSVHSPFLANRYVVINGTIRLTQNHPVLRGGAWVAAGALRVGDRLVGPDGGDRPIFSILQVEEQAQVYNFRVARGTYVAGGIVVHNKEECSAYVQYCANCPPGP